MTSQRILKLRCHMAKLRPEPELAMISGTSAMEAIALEANFIANAADIARQYFPSIVKQFKTLVGAIDFSKNVNKKEFTKSQASILRLIKDADKAALDSLQLDVPEGFNYNLLKTFSNVDNILSVINDDMVSYIRDYKKYLASFVTNKDAKKSLLDMTTVAKETAKKTQTVVSDTAKMFNVGSSNAKLKFFELFDNIQEVEQAFREYHKLNPKFKTLDVNKIKTDIEDISEMLDSVITQFNSGKVEYLTPEALKSLSEGSFAVAKSAEAIAIVYFKLIAIFNIVPNMEDSVTADILSL